MDIKTVKNGAATTLELSGRIDTTTAPALEAGIDFNGLEELVLDFKDVEYISSAGLRVLLNAQKTMNKQGKMSIKNVNADIMEIFELTGFSDILTIE